MKYILICPYNAAQIAKKELSFLGYKATIVTPTVLEFEGDEAAIARVSINSRIASKLYIKLAEGKANVFEDLFQIVTAIDWKKYIPMKHPFNIHANSKQSTLTSIPTLQSITKKAIANKLLGSDAKRWDEDTTIEPIHISINITQQNCSVLLDTTGDSLHNRGYRQHAGAAPLKENLAAALVLASGRKFSTPLVDPFCGAGTIAIEAALIAKNMAPGLGRFFAFEDFERYNKKHLEDAKAEAAEKVMLTKEHTIIGYDIDARMIELAKENAKRAGVENFIHFEQRDFLTNTNPLVPNATEETAYGIVTNPPYGERMKPVELQEIYQKLISLCEDNGKINGGFISNAPEAQTLIQPSYWKETRFFNGTIECTFYKIARL